MTTIATILEILKYTIPALVVLLAAHLIVKKFLVTEIQRKQLAIFKDGLDTTLRMRLQAYERLTLFIERIHPRQLLPRAYQSGMTVRDFQMSLIQAIRAEFEHNLSQQIYVSREVWKTIVGVHEQELAMINNIASQMNADAPGKELHQRITEYVLQAEDSPNEIAIEMLNNEAKYVLQQQA